MDHADAAADNRTRWDGGPQGSWTGCWPEVAAGDRDALARLYRLTRTAVYGLALSYVKNPQDAQDIAQDAFVRIWDSAPQYQSQGSPMGWILTVTRNLALMKLRSRGREAGLEEEQWLAIPADAPSVSPEDRALLEQALGTLEEQARRIVLLHAVTGLKHREIAQLLELPWPPFCPSTTAH